MTATKPADKRNPRDGEICAQSNGVICIFVFFLFRILVCFFIVWLGWGAGSPETEFIQVLVQAGLWIRG